MIMFPIALATPQPRLSVNVYISLFGKREKKLTNIIISIRCCLSWYRHNNNFIYIYVSDANTEKSHDFVLFLLTSL